MKTFKQFLLEASNYFKVGETIKFIPAEVSTYNDPSAMGGFDWGKVTSAGESYMVMLDNGNEITVKSEHAYAFGNADAT